MANFGFYSLRIWLKMVGRKKKGSKEWQYFMFDKVFLICNKFNNVITGVIR